MRMLRLFGVSAALVVSTVTAPALAKVTESTSGWVTGEGPPLTTTTTTEQTTTTTTEAVAPASTDISTTTEIPTPHRDSRLNPIDDRPPLSIFPMTAEDKLMDPRMVRSWAGYYARPFVSTTFDVGFVYFRPRVSLGYGKPFTKWIGIDANPVVSSDGAGVYGGLRVELPYVDFRAGPRYYVSFNRSYLPPKQNYERLDVETSAGLQQKILTYEADLSSQIPVGPGAVLLRGSISYVTNVPAGQYAFEETLRVVVNPPLVWRGRAGYIFRLGAYGQHSVGVVADVLDVPKRDDSVTVRVGPVVRVVLSRRVEVRGSFVMTVLSPDSLGLVGSDFTELGVRYRWATEP